MMEEHENIEKAHERFLDIMISYSPQDGRFVKKLADCLENESYSVWYYGKEMEPSMESYHASKQGPAKAIIDCKVFLQVMSIACAGDTQCQDELSLAHISNTAIFPISQVYFPVLAHHLTSGMKLILARINWTFFVKEEMFDENLEAFLKALKHHFTDQPDPTEDKEGDSEKGDDTKLDETSDQKHFWERHFPAKQEVTWIEFRENFLQDYGDRLADNFEEEQRKWVINLIYRDIFDLNKTIDKKTYETFAAEDTSKDVNHFYNRVIDYAIGCFAMKEVFSMESSVRLTAVENLGSFHTPGVIRALLGFLDDGDPNLRAVAALALGRTGTKSAKVINRLVKECNDEDRLVRQSSSLSLGKLKAVKQVPVLLEMWRNDAISHVREAALVALQLMGGDEAEQAIRVTQVLTKEMASLRQKADL